ATPVAPSGCPHPIRPPRGLTTTTPDQAAAGVDDDVAPVVAPAGGHERPCLALLAEAELLVGDHLGDREAVVHLGEIDVAGADAGHAVRRGAGALQRRPVGGVLV